VLITNVPGVDESTVAWGDYNNDGLLDFLLTGRDESNQTVTPLWRNTGTGFEPVAIQGLRGVYFGDAVWCDFNNDGRLDFLITGLTYDFNAIPSSGGTQAPTSNSSQCQAEVFNSSAAWGDYDNDSLRFLLVVGTGQVLVRHHNWARTGHGFKRTMLGDAPGVYDGSVAWGTTITMAGSIFS
jgi:hypothetical protein